MLTPVAFCQSVDRCRQVPQFMWIAPDDLTLVGLPSPVVPTELDARSDAVYHSFRPEPVLVALVPFPPWPKGDLKPAGFALV